MSIIIIPVALKSEEAGHSDRRKRKTLPGGVPFPIHRHSSFHKRKILDQIESGEIAEGIPVVPTTVSAISYNRSNNSVFEKASTIHARKIPLLDIRKRLLEKHEKLGILRISASDGEQMTRYMKMWHDHSSIAGLASIIYDVNIYLTQQEVDEKVSDSKFDVQSTVEAPELHILGRSSSSLEDQAHFTECRNECLSKLNIPLHLSNGTNVVDIL